MVSGESIWLGGGSKFNDFTKHVVGDTQIVLRFLSEIGQNQFPVPSLYPHLGEILDGGSRYHAKSRSEKCR